MSDASTAATYDDVLNAPPHQVAEIIDGALVLSPRPRPRHSAACLRLGAALDPVTRNHGDGWVLLIEPEWHTEAQVLVPDLAGWKRYRFPATEIEATDAAYLTVTPDWVCEILSPSTARLDRAHKARIYAAAGVSYFWLLDVQARILEVKLLNEDGLWTDLAVFAEGDVVRAEPFADLSWDLSQLWAW